MLLTSFACKCVRRFVVVGVIMEFMATLDRKGALTKYTWIEKVLCCNRCADWEGG